MPTQPARVHRPPTLVARRKVPRVQPGQLVPPMQLRVLLVEILQQPVERQRRETQEQPPELRVCWVNLRHSLHCYEPSGMTGKGHL